MMVRFALFLIPLFLTLSLFSDEEWENFKAQTHSEGLQLLCWHKGEKNLLMMDVIRENRCQFCVEIGVYDGSSLFSTMKALQYNGGGIVYAIDPWNRCQATLGLDPNDNLTQNLSRIDFDAVHALCVKLIEKHALQPYCHIIRKPSREVVLSIEDDSIDFLHIDGSYHEEFAFLDGVLYLPKVKDKGFILINNPHWDPMKLLLIYLLERTDVISSCENYDRHLLLRKNAQKMENAKALMKY